MCVYGCEHVVMFIELAVVDRDRPIMLIFHLLCYAAVLKNFT